MLTVQEILHKLETEPSMFIMENCEYIDHGSYRTAYVTNDKRFVIKRDNSRRPEFSSTGNRNEWLSYNKLISQFPRLERNIVKIYGVTSTYQYLLCEYVPNDVPETLSRWIVHNGRYYGNTRKIGDQYITLNRVAAVFHRFAQRAGANILFNDCSESNVKMREGSRIPVMIDLGNVDL